MFFESLFCFSVIHYEAFQTLIFFFPFDSWYISRFVLALPRHPPRKYKLLRDNLERRTIDTISAPKNSINMNYAYFIASENCESR